MKTYILLPWVKSLSLATPRVDQLLLLSQFPYRFQRMGSVPGTSARSGMEHHLIFYSHSSQWTSSDCLPHQSGHSAVQDSLYWNLFSHHPGNRPHWHLYLPPFTAAVQDAVCLAGRLFGMACRFPSIPTALIFTQPLISQFYSSVSVGLSKWTEPKGIIVKSSSVFRGENHTNVLNEEHFYVEITQSSKKSDHSLRMSLFIKLLKAHKLIPVKKCLFWMLLHSAIHNNLSLLWSY